MSKRLLTGLVLVLALAGCATVSPDNLKPGASTEDIKAQMGTPRASYALPGGGQRLEFRGRGERTYMVDVDASGKMVRWTQVLNETNFRNIIAGMTREQVLMTLGQPDEKGAFGRQRTEVWSWHFQNLQCQWFQVSFDANGRTPGGGTMGMMPSCLNVGGGA